MIEEMLSQDEDLANAWLQRVAMGLLELWIALRVAHGVLIFLQVAIDTSEDSGKRAHKRHIDLWRLETGIIIHVHDSKRSVCAVTPLPINPMQPMRFQDLQHITEVSQPPRGPTLHTPLI